MGIINPVLWIFLGFWALIISVIALIISLGISLFYRNSRKKSAKKGIHFLIVALFSWISLDVLGCLIFFYIIRDWQLAW
jgi:hypothetical protein